MIRTCEECGATYDDLVSVCCCPHERFISDQDAGRKDLAFALVGQDLQFVDKPGGPLVHIQSIDSRGMVRVTGLDAQFDPSKFVEVRAHRARRFQGEEGLHELPTRKG